MITQYIHDKKKNKLRGVLIADKTLGDYPIISWSYTNFKAGDKFNKQRAILIAKSRIDTKTNAQVPRQVIKMSEIFKKRVSKYYKVDIDTITLVGKGEKF